MRKLQEKVNIKARACYFDKKNSRFGTGPNATRAYAAWTWLRQARGGGGGLDRFDQALRDFEEDVLWPGVKARENTCKLKSPEQQQ